MALVGDVMYAPMNSQVHSILLTRVDKPQDAYVFGPPQRWEGANKYAKKLAIKAGVRPIRFHDSRHTFCTSMARAGHQDKLLMLMGHKTNKMTERYKHLDPGFISGTTEVLCNNVISITEAAKHGTARLLQGGTQMAHRGKNEEEKNGKMFGN